MLIDESGTVLWELNLPNEIPREYSLQDIATFVRGYLKDYPVFVREFENELLVIGYPKDSYFKITSNYLPYKGITYFPIFAISMFVLDVVLLFIIYMVSRWKISQSIEPIVNAIDKLSSGESVYIHPTGELSQLSDKLNKASDVLVKKDSARATWISGISHDLRTPLSMILAYASQLAESDDLDVQKKAKADTICKQSIKIKNLISDLNLASKLEYDMQAINPCKVHMAKLLREIAADYSNTDYDGKYAFNLSIENSAKEIFIFADASLIKRAIENLLINSINHNPNGCEIEIKAESFDEDVCITVSDNGAGNDNTIFSKQNGLDKEQNNDLELQHGLGLRIVEKIMIAHDGCLKISNDSIQGFSVCLVIPLML